MEQKEIIAIITLAVLAIVALIMFIIKLNKKKMRKIMQSVSPMWIEYYDVLVYRYSDGENTYTKTLPILKNKRDNSFYIPSIYGDYGYLNINVEDSYTENPKVVSKNIKKENVEFNKQGRIYIEKEKGKVTIDNNIINIDGKKLTYEGIINGKLAYDKAYSTKNENILEELNGAIIYCGILDFDMEGVLIEHLQ